MPPMPNRILQGFHWLGAVLAVSFAPVPQSHGGWRVSRQRQPGRLHARQLCVPGEVTASRHTSTTQIPRAAISAHNKRAMCMAAKRKRHFVRASAHCLRFDALFQTVVELDLDPLSTGQLLPVGMALNETRLPSSSSTPDATLFVAAPNARQVMACTCARQQALCHDSVSSCMQNLLSVTHTSLIHVVLALESNREYRRARGASMISFEYDIITNIRNMRAYTSEA